MKKDKQEQPLFNDATFDSIRNSEDLHRNAIASILNTEEKQIFLQYEQQLSKHSLQELKPLLEKLKKLLPIAPKVSSSSSYQQIGSISGTTSHEVQSSISLSFDTASPEAYNAITNSGSCGESGNLNIRSPGKFQTKKEKSLRRFSINRNSSNDDFGISSSSPGDGLDYADSHSLHGMEELSRRLARSGSSCVTNTITSPGLLPELGRQNSMSDILEGMEMLEAVSHTGMGGLMKPWLARSSSQHLLGTHSNSTENTPTSTSMSAAASVTGSSVASIQLQSNPRNPVVARRTAEIDKMLIDMSNKNQGSGVLSRCGTGSGSGKHYSRTNRRATLSGPPSLYAETIQQALAELENDSQDSSNYGHWVKQSDSPHSAAMLMSFSERSRSYVDSNDSNDLNAKPSHATTEARQYSFPKTLPPSTITMADSSANVAQSEESSLSSDSVMNLIHGSSSSGESGDKFMLRGIGSKSRDNSGDTIHTEVSPTEDGPPSINSKNSQRSSNSNVSSITNASNVDNSEQQNIQGKATSEHARARWRHSLSALDRMKLLNTRYPTQWMTQQSPTKPAPALSKPGITSSRSFYTAARYIQTSQRGNSRNRSIDQYLEDSPLATAPAAVVVGGRRKKFFGSTDSFDSNSSTHGGGVALKGIAGVEQSSLSPNSSVGANSDLNSPYSTVSTVNAFSPERSLMSVPLTPPPARPSHHHSSADAHSNLAGASSPKSGANRAAIDLQEDHSSLSPRRRSTSSPSKPSKTALAPILEYSPPQTRYDTCFIMKKFVCDEM